MSVKIEQAFILKTFVINESDRVVVAINENGQKVSLVAKGGNRLKSRFQGKLEPFSFVKLEYFDRGKGGLNSLNNVELEENLQKWVKGDMKKFLALSFISEVTDRFVYEKEKNPRLFRLVNHVVDSLKQNSDLKLGVSYFCIWILKLSGLLKEVGEDIPCLKEVLENPLNKINCKDTIPLFDTALSLVLETSDKPFNSATMLKTIF